VFFFNSDFVFTNLLRLIVGGVGGVALLVVAVVALDAVIVLGLFNHHHLRQGKVEL